MPAAHVFPAESFVAGWGAGPYFVAMASTIVSGIHHITGIAGDARANVAFYRDLLGLRLVKRTVNFDDPNTWHLYYGTGTGNPGSILTFFPWGPMAAKGRRGNGQVVEVALAVPAGSLDFWEARLSDGLKRADREEKSIQTADSDGFPIRLMESDLGADIDPASPTVEDRYAVRGIADATLATAAFGESREFIHAALGWQPQSDTAPVVARIESREGHIGSGVTLVADTAGNEGRMGSGTMHHIAFRARDDEHQSEVGDQVRAAGGRHTDVKDRNYFRSIYFREPGGILYEVATDPPGFTVDESPEELGSTLKLPDWFEERRAELERRLAPLE